MLVLKVRQGEFVEIGPAIFWISGRRARPEISASPGVPVVFSPDRARIGDTITIKLLPGRRIAIDAPADVVIQRSNMQKSA